MGATAQELNLPIQNQYIGESDFILAAAFAGIGDCWQLRLNGVSYWAGIKDAPNTQSLSVNGKIADRSGIGLTLFNDQNGYTSQKGATISYAHHLTLNEDSKQYLSFGISYRFTQFNIDFSEFDDGAGNNDLAILGNEFSLGNSNFDVSVLYRLGNFFFSANLINMVPKDIDEFDIREPENLGNLFFYSGYTFKPKGSDFEIEPSIFYQRFLNDGRTTTDLNLKVRKLYDEDYYWAGVNMRFINEQEFKPLYVAPMIGVQINKFYAAYSYQININEFNQYGSGSHMITLGYDFLCWESVCGCTQN